MSDMKQRYLPDWVILGDHSRTVFLGWLLSGARLVADESSVIWIRYGARLSITQHGSHWTIETPILLPQTTLCFPPTDGYESNVELSQQTKYAVLEEFPFRKQNSTELIHHLESDGHETLVVLMDLPRHQGSTDLIAPGKDLEQAVGAYQADGCDVSVLQSARNLHGVLHWHRPIYDVWTKRARKYLEELCERISEISCDYLFLEEDWKEEGGPLQEETMDILFSYQTAKREKEKNLWDCFAAASKRALFPRSGQGPLMSVMELYRECLDNPMVFWPVDADIKNFMNSLQSEFLKALEEDESKGHYRNKTMLSEQFNEDSYFRLISRNGRNGTALNAVFSQRIRNFLCDDVKCYLQKRLQMRYQQLEGMIQ